MSVDILLRELRKTGMDETTQEKILNMWFEEENRFKTRIKKEDVHLIALLQTIVDNPRWSKLPEMKISVGSWKKLTNFFLDDLISEESGSRKEFTEIMKALRMKTENEKSANRWLGEE